MNNIVNKDLHHVVIIGGGFGGLWAAKSLKHAPVRVTVIDKRNFHLFQPLLYQVATGGLSPADIASPLRGVLGRNKNLKVVLGEVIKIDPDNQQITLRDGLIKYDSLIVAAGSENSYFGHDEWEKYAPGLKGIEDALIIRGRIYAAFEKAEKETDPEKVKRLLTFIIVGGGPTGVELAGALGEIANITLKGDFRTIDTSDARIILVEGGPRILPTYPEKLSQAAVKSLNRLGVEVMTGATVSKIDQNGITANMGDDRISIDSTNVMWAAGIKPSRIGKILAGGHNEILDKTGRIMVEPDLTMKGYPDIFVIGDIANFTHQTGEPLPGVAPVALSQGQYAGKTISARLKGRKTKPYHYFNKGNLAVIGRAAAVADFGWLRVSGYPAWLLWLFVHLMYLVEFDNRIIVFIQWAWNYFTRNRGARLITYRLDGE
jgi:NADH dehydrogenase